MSRIALEYFGSDSRVQKECIDGADWIKNYHGDKLDLVFADAWPGKYSELEELLDLIKIGGLYVIDDMSPQSNWPGGHAEKAAQLIECLENRPDLVLTKLNWSTGMIIATKVVV